MIDVKTISDLAREAGVQAYRIAYAIQTGSLPAPRIVGGRRLWTSEEAEIVKAYFQDRHGPTLGRPPRKGGPRPPDGR